MKSMKENGEKSAVAYSLELSVERLYTYLDGQGMIDWGVEVSHPMAAGIDAGSAKLKDRAVLATVDIDILILRLMSKAERRKKKESRRAARLDGQRKV